MTVGKVPPQSVEMEEAVLGAIMVEKDAIVFVSDILKSEHFYRESHRILYDTIISLYTDNKDIDILTVSQHLSDNKKLDEVGGYAYITQLTAEIAGALHIKSHALIIVQKFIQREIIRASSNAMKMAFDGDEDILSSTINNLMKIGELSNIGKPESIGAVLDEVMKTAESIRNGDRNILGLSTLISDLDRVSNGLIAPDLIIVAARPGVGKTAFAMTIVHNLSVVQGVAVGIFSMEMSKEQLAKRVQVLASQIYNEKVKNPKLMSNEEWEKYKKYNEKIKKTPIHIDDTSGLDIIQLKSKAIMLKKKYDIKYIIVDYLQLMSGIGIGIKKTANREGEVSEISRGLKGLAKELNIPIIALSQLNRKVEDRSDKKPRLSDLRESGAIEQDADSVWFIHRPSMYGDEEIEDDYAEIIIEKHRDGETGIIQMRFIKHTMTFEGALKTAFAKVENNTPF